MKFVKKTQFPTFACMILLLFLLESSPRSYGYSYSWDIHTNYPFAATKLDQADITPEMVSRMNYVDSNYTISNTTPNGSGISSSQMQELRDVAYVKYAIVRDAQSGEVTGKTITIDTEDEYKDLSEVPGFNSDWLPDIITINSYYKQCSSAQRTEIEQIYLDMVELWLNV
jgi:hypothetical protein